VTDTVELRAGAARVRVAPAVGGSIAAFEYDGQPVLRPTSGQALSEGNVRNFSCFPLVPFSNRIAGAILHWADREYALTRFVASDPNAIHGNGWQRAWRLVQQASSSLTLELDHDASGERASEWPFPYRAWQRFDLVAVGAQGARLALELGIENVGNVAFPFGLGWHPYFDRASATELGFSAEAVWRTDAGHLPTSLDPIPAQWSFDPPRDIGATLVDNCFTGWQPPATVRWPTRQLEAELGASVDCAVLIVFVPDDRLKQGRSFSLEPVTHITDAFNLADAGRGATGTRVLAPGASFSCTMSISVSRSG
jgi:aldose 1-epimerase